MDAYTDFASVYDTFMDETPYEEWADYLVQLIKQYGISETISQEEAQIAREHVDKEQIALLSEKNLILDLGCGTGTLTELMAARGYDMVGVDNSEEMLNIAMTKKEKSESTILYLCQDMQNLELYSTVGTVISVCDSINYVLTDKEILQTFERVNNYLYPGGIFIFDFNTLYKYETVIGDTTIAENRDDCSFIWENYFHEEEQINEYDLTIFVKEQLNGQPLPNEDANGAERFRKFTETHFQRGYTLEKMKQFVSEAGMQLVAVIDADTHEVPGQDSERIYVVARECGK